METIARLDEQPLSDGSLVYQVELWDGQNHVATLSARDKESAELIAETINQLAVDLLHIEHYE